MDSARSSRPSNNMKNSVEDILKTIKNEKELQIATKEMHEFLKIFRRFLSKPKSTIDWAKISPPPNGMVKKYKDLPTPDTSKLSQLLSKLAVVKLNGGLGTSMGCTGPKSVIEVSDHITFLDMTVLQVESLCREYNVKVPLVLMNSFNTHDDTMRVIEKYKDHDVEVKCFNQSRHPRFWKESLTPCAKAYDSPVDYWYPPGHGDVYEALVNSGILDQLLAEGKEWIFVSNIDNCGATVDLNILSHCMNSDSEFLMEVTDKTRSDIKGGTLIEYEGKATLLEIAQVAPEYTDEFKSIKKFKIFNTNNLWMKLDAVKRVTAQGLLEDMDLIANPKAVNGKAVLQLERAAGAAIQFFKNGHGVNVPRSRFLPVKTCSDLFVIQSNLYDNVNGCLVMNKRRAYPLPPLVRLGDAHFKKVADYQERFQGIPDIVELDHLTVSGNVYFGRGVVLKGTVIIVASEGDRIDIPPGSILENKVVTGNLRMLDH